MAIISGGGIIVEIDVVLSEKLTRQGKITSSPIEGNLTVSDHFARDPFSLVISGVCTTNAANKHSNLAKIHREGIVCSYSGRNVVDSVVITKFDSDHGANVDNAFSFTMSLVEVRISSTQEFQYSTSTSEGEKAAQTKKKTNVGASSSNKKSTDKATTQATVEKAKTLSTTYGKWKNVAEVK